ncbi:MAG: hypothetical protein Q9207_006932 [Kuettlingeria erythrocarpa]
MAHWETYTITTTTEALVLEGYKTNTILSPRVREASNPSPVSTSVLASVRPEALTGVNSSDGVQSHSVTITLPLTTLATTTITANGLTETIPGTIAVVNDAGPQVYPGEGCLDDFDCLRSHIHSTAIPAKATSPLPGVTVKDHNTENAPSFKRFMKDAGPFIGLGVGVACLVLLGFWLLVRYQAMKRKRRDGARERQGKRMGQEEAVTREEGGDLGGDAEGRGIELEVMRRDGHGRAAGLGSRVGGGRSDTWATTASTDSWFVVRRSTTDDFV